jgi:lysophospholipase L1-like esterase
VTYRNIVHTSIGGRAVRIIVTNEFGQQPLTIGAASIALSKGGGTIYEPKLLTFSGQSSITLPVGTKAFSDPVGIALPPLADLAVSLFVPAQPMTQLTLHSYALQTNYIAEGNAVDSLTLDSPKETPSWYFVKGIEVQPAKSSGVIVALGDSITDGALSPPNTNTRWTDDFSARLQADKALKTWSVVNAGINGNRLLHDDEDGTNEGALRRLDRDVLTLSGVRYLIVLEGINDIGHIVSASANDPAETAPRIIRALQQIALRAHARGIKVVGATILPYESCKYASVEGEKMRQTVNEWIRNAKDMDYVADFEKAIRDPAHPTRFLPAYDSGDHLHPNAAGLHAMADSIDLRIFSH